jgi:hypothetical protein
MSDEVVEYEEEFNRLWQALVPEQGDAPTVQGELLRAIGRLLHECEDNGNVNWEESDYYRSLTNFLELHLCDVEFCGEQGLTWINDALAKARDFNDCDADALIYLRSVVVGWCKEHPNPLPRISQRG